MNKKKHQRDPANGDESSDSGDENQNSAECSHIHKAVDLAKVKKVVVKAGFLTDCEDCKKQPLDPDFANLVLELDLSSDLSLWLCLKCGNQACGRGKNMHALKHYNTPHSDSHAMCVNTTIWSIWCYDCDNEVNSTCKKKLHEAFEYLKKQAESNKIKQQVYIPTVADKEYQTNSSRMNESFIEVNGVPTKVITWGRSIEESRGNSNELIILIPGNPGVPGFYKKFANTLYGNTEIPIWCVGHAGHNFADPVLTKCPKFEKHKSLYGLQGQIDHKIDFFKRYVPSGTKVYLIAHSIGSYMTLEMLQDADVKSKIHQAYLLFPTIEHMAATKNGRFLNNFVRPIVGFILILTWIFSILPNFLMNVLLYVYMFFANIPRDLHAENIKKLLKPGILRRVFFLAFEEMDQVKQRNNAVIQDNLNKIKFYYGRTDGWAPEQFCLEVKRDIKNIDAELTDINHTFVFHHSVAVACSLSDWIKAKN